MIIFLGISNLSYCQWYIQATLPTDFLWDIFYSDANNGWIASSDGIYHTTDGGNNWQIQVSPYISAYSTFFLDNNNGWAVGNIILHTSNGGNNWGWVQQPSGTNEALLDVCFTDINHGICVGSNGVILRTADGGNNWSTQNSQPGPTLNSVWFIDNNNGIAVGEDAGSPTFSPTIIKTTDGGITWMEQNPGLFFFSADLNDVCFVNSNVGYAVGTELEYPTFRSKGLILKTVDGGASWSINLQDTAVYFFSSVSFADEFNGLVVGTHGEILITTDAGVTWLSEQNNISNWLYSVKYFTSGFVTAVGSGGAVLRRDNSVVPSLALVNPLSGENLEIGSETQISWSSFGINYVKLEWRSHPYEEWIEIVSGFPANENNYLWTVPNAITTEAEIRISDLSNILSSSVNNLRFYNQNTIIITHGYTFNNDLDPIQWEDLNWLFGIADSVSNNRQILLIHSGITYTTDMITQDFTNLSNQSPGYPIEDMITEGLFYEITSLDLSKDIVIIFDWSKESANAAPGFSEAAADALIAVLIQNAKKFPGLLENLHFIGHSRGGVVISEAIERLIHMAANNLLPHNVRIDQNIHMTTLDAHPAGHWNWLGGQLLSMKDDEVNSANIVQDGKRIGVAGWKSGLYKTGFIDNYYENLGSTMWPIIWLKGLPSYPGSFFNYCLDDFFQYRMNWHSLVTTWYYGTVCFGPDYDKFGFGAFINRAQWYTDGIGKMEGFYHSLNRNSDLTGIQSNETYLINVGADQNYRQQHLIFNGDFSKSGPFSVFQSNQFHEIAGWSYQGGTGIGRIHNYKGGNNVLLLGKFQILLTAYYYPELAHNYFYIPTNVDKIQFRMSVEKESANDILIVEIGGLEQQFSLTQKTQMEWKYIDISQLKGTIQTLKFSVVTSDPNINAQVFIDDVGFIKNNQYCSSVACPVVFHIYDNSGNHTGPIDDSTYVENIPGSQYYVYEDSTGDKIKAVFLEPLDEMGEYYFRIESQDTTSYFSYFIEDYSDSSRGTIIFEFDSIAIGLNTVATCTLDVDVETPILNVDIDGDGTIDTTYTPVVITAVENLEISEYLVPSEYKLCQNYPNPFNPTTTIKYYIPNAVTVKLVVYDLLGREIKTLVNDFQQRGEHSIEFDGSYLSSGVYFYSLKAGEFMQMKKLILMR